MRTSEPRRRRTRHLARNALSLGSTLFLLLSCGFDRADRWLVAEEHAAPLCKVGEMRCTTGVERCSKSGDGLAWTVVNDCAASGLVCVPDRWECKTCLPNARRCDGQDTLLCDGEGNHETKLETCDTTQGTACRAGQCVNLCSKAKQERSNVGCEYWAVDLDNANVGAGLNAAAQQYSVVVSNPQPDVFADVVVERDDSAPGQPNQPLGWRPPRSLRSACAYSSSDRARWTARLPVSSTRERTPHSPAMPTASRANSRWWLTNSTRSTTQRFSPTTLRS
ncbi:MAG: hypothetical protein U0263_26885 [Polyangiaceae bacterium]